MKNISRHIGLLTDLKRLPSSINGNPRFCCRIDGVFCMTSVDSSYGYSIQNYENKKVIATIGTYYGKPTIDSLKGA